MRKYFERIGKYFRSKRSPGYEYPVDEKQFEKNPLKVRTSEVSQFQDEARDIETRSPEREVFDQQTFEAAQESLHHPQTTTEHSGANPTRENRQ